MPATIMLVSTAESSACGSGKTILRAGLASGLAKRRRFLRDLRAMEQPPAFPLRRERGGTMFEVPFS